MKPVSGRCMCRILEGRGWILVRVSGSHHVYRHPPTGRQTTVPVHGNQGTQRSIMRDADFTDDDL